MDSIARLRQSNRAVTRHIGVLENDFLGRKRSIGESRVLYEIGVHGVNRRELRASLDLDSGYCSRLIRALELEGLVKSLPSKSDGRVRFLQPTSAGKREIEKLDKARGAI